MSEIKAVVERLNSSGYEYKGGPVTARNVVAVIDMLLQQLDDAAAEVSAALRERAEPGGVPDLHKVVYHFRDLNDGFPVERFKADYVIAWMLANYPPAPVVTDDRESFEKFYGSGTTPGLDRVPPWFQEMIKDAFWEVWKGSRAAMLITPVKN